MEREMHQVAVSFSVRGDVRISQELYPGEEAVVIIHPSQVDMFCDWLKQVRDEIMQMRVNGESFGEEEAN